MTRYSVKTNSIPPKLAALGFAAWICDSEHPDGESASCSWHQDEADAWRICRALNAEPKLYRALQDLEAECHGYNLAGNPVGPQYDYEGEPVDIAEFIRDNEITHADDLSDIRNLKVGEELRYGGGAAPITVLRRVR